MLYFDTLLQVLQSIPWDKVDISVITLEIVRGKLNENAVGDHVDSYDDIITLLTSKGYKEIKSIPHTPEEISFESIFIHENFKPLIEDELL